MKRDVAKVLVSLGILLVSGTLGYRLIEGWPLLDALYQTVITLSTVGFGEVRPLSPYGRLFTVFLILLGVGTVAWGASLLGRVVMEGELLQFFGRRTKRRRVGMKSHVVVCGFGRMGRAVAENLRNLGERVLVVEKDPAVASRAREMGFGVVVGDATLEETLRSANLVSAKALASLLPDDPDNLYVVMMARSLAPRLFIVAKALGEQGAKRLKLGGADRVISVYQMGAQRAATWIAKPEVGDFLDIAAWRIEELHIGERSSLAGKTPKELELRSRFGINLLAIKRGDRVWVASPDDRIQAGDILLIMGDREALSRLR